jgi:endonuclease YncB( thermonuclease family)
LIRTGAASRRLVAAAALWLACAAAAAAPLAGRVVHVHDGDTLTVLVDRREARVRLAGIDAPERGQPFATASRRALSARVAGRDVVVDVQGRDGFGRTLGVVRVAGTDVNREQVRDGWAWVFRRFSHDPALLALEDEARRAGRGLWRDPRPVPPWTWRETHPPRAPAAPPAGR